MRRTERLPVRAGFTLIELMTVVAILALLAALVAAGIGQVRQAQMSRNTDATLTKLQQALNTKWGIVRDDCTTGQNKVPQAIVDYCDGDRERAQSLWLYLNLRRNFPQSFQEALTPVTVGGVTLQPMATFRNVTVPTTLTAEEQSAVLLYLIVGTGTSGDLFSADDVTAGAQMPLGNHTVFMDAWGTPIAFARFAQSPVLNQPPYTDSKTTIKDTLDPRGKLSTWTTGRGPVNKPFAEQAVFFPGSGASFDGNNRMVTAYSAGADQAFTPSADGDDQDNVYGYTLTKLGKTGN